MVAVVKHQMYYTQGPIKPTDKKLLTELTGAFKYQDLSAQLIEYKRIDKKPLIHI
jgi:hypothetical protein